MGVVVLCHLSQVLSPRRSICSHNDSAYFKLLHTKVSVVCGVDNNISHTTHVLWRYSVISTAVSEIGAVVKVVDSHLWGWGSIPGKSCKFLIVSLRNGLSPGFMCSDQHALTSSLLLDYQVKKYIYTQTTHVFCASPLSAPHNTCVGTEVLQLPQT